MMKVGAKWMGKGQTQLSQKTKYVTTAVDTSVVAVANPSISTNPR